MNKLMHFFKKHFTYKEGNWEKTKSKGIVKFLINYGIIRIGFLGGIIVLFFSYLQDLNFEISKFSLITYFLDYLVNIPYALLIGCIIAVGVWILEY